MNRRRLCQLTAAILTSDDTYMGFMKRHSDYHVTIIPAPSGPNSIDARVAMT